MYGGNSASIDEGGASMGVGIHKVKVVGVKAFTTEPKKEGGATYDVLDIIYQNKQGETFNQRCFSPEVDDDKERAKKNAKYYSNLVCYIGSKLHNKDVELPKVKTWDEFTKAACDLLNGHENVNLWLKLVGNYYNGKSNVQITRYFGWLERADLVESKEKAKPKFSQNEVKANAEYEASLTNISGSGVPGAEDDDAPF